MSIAPPAIQPAAAETQSLHMTYDEFLAWADEDTHAEWVNGEVIIHMPPKDPHQMLVQFLDRVLGLFIRVFDLGRLQIAPFELKLQPAGNSREPDLMFLTKEHLDRLTEDRVSGPPDLIIEIVSTDSVHRDRVDKFDEYEAGGVPEYWIIDNRPNRQRAYFYQLSASGLYQPVPVGKDGIYRSAVLPNFWLRVEWLWQLPPDELQAIAEIIGPEQVAQALRQRVEHH